MPPNEAASDLAALHISTYDALAPEYERRTGDLVPVTEDAVAWMARYLVPGGRVLDLGCGVGLAASLFAAHGFEVSCLDISPKMIAYAKRRNPGARFFEDDFLSPGVDGRFDGIFAFAFIHLFPKAVALQVLEKVHRMLDAEGIFYVGSTKSDVGSEGYEVKKDYGGGHARFRKHWTKDELQDALVDSGFIVLDMKEYTDPFGKTWMDFMAKKAPRDGEGTI